VGGLAIAAQQFQTFDIPLAGGSRALVYFGERWGSAPTGLKADDFSAWAPITFNDSAGGAPVPFAGLVPSFQLDLPVA